MKSIRLFSYILIHRLLTTAAMAQFSIRKFRSYVNSLCWAPQSVWSPPLSAVCPGSSAEHQPRSSSSEPGHQNRISNQNWKQSPEAENVSDGMMVQIWGGPHLLLLTLSLHWDGVMTAVVRLCAQHTHTPLVAPAEQLQEPLVPFTHPVLQHCYRFNQLVNLQGGNSQVWLQVTLTIWGQTHKAGLQGLGLLSHARITTYEFSCHWRCAVLSSCSDLFWHFLGEGVFTKLWAALKDSLTFGTADGEAIVPVWCDAGEAEAVTARNGDGLGENIPTDTALKLHLWKENAGGGHDFRNKEGRSVSTDYEKEINHLHSESQRKCVLITLTFMSKLKAFTKHTLQATELLLSLSSMRALLSTFTQPETSELPYNH